MLELRSNSAERTAKVALEKTKSSNNLTNLWLNEEKK